MLSGDGNENSEKKNKTIGLITKKIKKTLHVQHTFVLFCFDYNVNLPETS